MQQRMFEPFEFWIGNERVRIGRAKRNCRCDECKEQIMQGEPRITLDGHFFEHRCDRHYHVDCKIDFLLQAKNKILKALAYIKEMYAMN